jgi:hypothetical protein
MAVLAGADGAVPYVEVPWWMPQATVGGPGRGQIV